MQVTQEQTLVDIATELSLIEKTKQFFGRTVKPHDLTLPDRLYDGLMITTHVVNNLAALVATHENKRQVDVRRPVHLFIGNLLLACGKVDAPTLNEKRYLRLLDQNDLVKSTQDGLVMAYTHLLPYAVDDNILLSKPLLSLINYLENMAQSIGLAACESRCNQVFSTYRPITSGDMLPINHVLPSDDVVSRVCAAAKSFNNAYSVAGVVYVSNGNCWLSLVEGAVKDAMANLTSDPKSFVRLR